MKSPWIDQKSVRASASSVVSVGWDSSTSSWSSELKSPLLTVSSRLWVGSRNSLSLPDNFAAPSATGNIYIYIYIYILISLLWYEYFFRIDSPRINLWCVHLFQFFDIRNHNVSIPKFTPQSAHTQERFLAKLSCQIDEAWLVSCRNRIIFNHCTELLGHRGHLADSNSIPKNQPTTIHQILIVVFLVFRRACDGMVVFAALNLHTCHWQGCSRALNPRRSGTSAALVDEPGSDSHKNHWTLSGPWRWIFERSVRDTLWRAPEQQRHNKGPMTPSAALREESGSDSLARGRPQNIRENSPSMSMACVRSTSVWLTSQRFKLNNRDDNS